MNLHQSFHPFSERKVSLSPSIALPSTHAQQKFSGHVEAGREE